MASTQTRQPHGGDADQPKNPYQLRIPAITGDASSLVCPLDAIINDIHAKYAESLPSTPRTLSFIHPPAQPNHHEPKTEKPTFDPRGTHGSPRVHLEPEPLFTRSPAAREQVPKPSASNPRTEASKGQPISSETAPSDAPTESLIGGPATRQIDKSGQDALELRRSVCQSPSWDAYNLRKQEKKDAKKEKERAARAAKTQSAKLTKPPPASNALRRQTMSDFNVSSPSDVRSRSNDRSASVQELERSGRYGAAKKKSRSRSSSITSFFRIPFESHRRQSIDQTTDREFIGGFKLEGQMLAANPDTNDESCCGRDPEALGTHPALRTGPDESESWSASQKLSQPALQTQSNISRCHYPPIAMQTSSSATTQALVAAEALPMSDSRGRKGLRARVGLMKSGKKSEANDCQMSQPETNTTSNRTSKISRPRSSAGEASPPLRSSGDHGFMAPASSPVFKNSYGTSYAPPSPASSTGRARHSMESPARPGVRTVSRKIVKANSHQPPDVTRRHNLFSRSASSDGAEVIGQRDDGRKRISEDTARVGFSKSPAMPQNQLAPQRPVDNNALELDGLRPPNIVFQGQISSSEGSLSEDFHSVSSATTPDSSRPQSTKGDLLGSPSQKTHTANQTGGTSDARVRAPAHYATSPLEHELTLAFAGPYSNSQSPTSAEYLHEDTPAPTIPPRLRDRALNPVSQEKGPGHLAARWSSSVELQTPQSHEQSLLDPQISKAGLRTQRKSLHVDTSHKTLSSVSHPPKPTESLDSSRDVTIPAPLHPRPRTSSGLIKWETEAAPASAADRYPHEPIGKIFVECCGCRYLHDMPSKLYELMSHPASLLTGSEDRPGLMDYTSAVTTTVKCPWCQHGMSKKCCAGLATIVYVQERLH